MTAHDSVDLRELRHLPLFRALSDEHLTRFVGALTPRDVAAGTVLFSSGDISTSFQILVSGEVELLESGEPPITLRPVAPIGELGALAGLPRNASATAKSDARILEASRDSLMAMLASSGELGFAFLKGLVEVVADKIRRDKLRANDMRGNIVRTQKAMKELRELVLSSEENALSQPVCDKLDDLIEHNRRSHYRVCPVEYHPASAGIVKGETSYAVVPVVELSEGFVKLASSATEQGLVKQGDEVTLVIKLPRGEVPVSGRVERTGKDGALVRLDPLIDEFNAALGRYMNELQMLDFVV
ncbi:MAG: cyclic nucleotide-binding domain-containing protein [Polyangiaceae bacterium]